MHRVVMHGAIDTNSRAVQRQGRPRPAAGHGLVRL